VEGEEGEDVDEDGGEANEHNLSSLPSMPRSDNIKGRSVIRLVSLIREYGESRTKGLPVLHDPIQRILHFGLDAGNSSLVMRLV
jgi:hypothetical protein